MNVAVLPPAPRPARHEATVIERLRGIVPFLQAEAEAGDASGSITPAAWAAMDQAGVLQAVLPVVEGGENLGEAEHAAELFDVLRLLGTADLCLARLFEGHANAVMLVARYGTARQLRDLAADVRKGALSAVWAADGAHPLWAEPDGPDLLLRGEKILASGAGLVRRPLATAATPDGPLLLLLDLARGTRADTSGWTAQGMRSTATGTIDLDGFRLPGVNVIGNAGDFLRQPALSGGAWRFCAAHLGGADRLVDLFRAHLIDRGRDGDPYQLQRVANCAVAVKTAEMWIQQAAATLANSAAFDAASTVAQANLTRMVTERAALDVIETVQRGMGLGAFIRPNPVERVARDLATYLRQPVPDLAMADAARFVLKAPGSVANLWEKT